MDTPKFTRVILTNSLGLNRVGFLDELSVHGDAARDSEADFSFSPNCNARTILQATFSEEKVRVKIVQMR